MSLPIDTQQQPAGSPSYFGTFTFPVEDNETPSDPSTRPYLAPPKLDFRAKRTYPLIDIRQDIFKSTDTKPDYATAAAFLRTHGFTALRHRSQLSSPEAFEDVQLMDRVYYPEIQALVRELTGARRVFVTNSFVRGPARAGKLPATVKSAVGSKPGVAGRDPGAAAVDHEQPMHKPSGTAYGRPVHMDYTPLGARQAVRFWRKDIYTAAKEAGIIDHEDALCTSHRFTATNPLSSAHIAASYNSSSISPPPRYAAFSIWRPLKPVHKDPLAYTHYSSIALDPDLLFWQYDIRVPGPEGDWNRQLELVRVRAGAEGEKEGDEALKWYFLAAQQVDEVSVVKFFDSKALGGAGEEAFGAPHASPELVGAREGAEARESIEARVIAIW